MPTGRDFHARTTLPMQADRELVTRLISDLMCRLDDLARRGGFIPDWSGVSINTEANVYEDSTFMDTEPIILGTTTTITACVRGVKDD